MSAPENDHRQPVVHLVDDDPALLRSISMLLRGAGFHVRSYESVEAFVAERGESRGCAVLDLHMPGAGGLELQERLAGSDNPLPVVFLTGHGDVRSSVRAMKGGAVDFLTKPASSEELVAAVRRAIALDERARAERRHVDELYARYQALTPRERQVFALVARGLLNKQIAGTLGTSERTIKAHRANVMQKMRLPSVSDLVRAAERLRDLMA